MDGGAVAVGGAAGRYVLALLLAWGFGALSACGGDDPGAVSVGAGGSSGGGASSGSGARGGAGSGGASDAGEASDASRDAAARDGGEASDAGVDAAGTTRGGGPIVEIEEPVEARDPNEDPVLTELQVTVRCRVQQGMALSSSPVDESSVVIRLVGAEGLEDPIDGSVNVVGDGLYEATFGLGNYANGPIDFDCTASDVAATPATGSAARRALLDLGPTITIMEPVHESVHALKQPVAVRFRVEAAPVSSDDEEAGVADVRLEVSGVSVPLTEDSAQPGYYALSVDFDDRSLFPMAPSTARFTVVATNARTPDAAERSATVDIELDAAGPEIQVKSPAHLSLVRGDVQLEVSIKDSSGVDADTVYGSINLGLHELTDWRVNGDTYTERFDTLSFGVSLTQLTINITASDTVGNESVASHILRLDNVPPVVSLDPPFVREWMVQNDERRCGEYIDPVGNWATNDGDRVLASSLYRAMVWERTNTSPGQVFPYHAGTNKDAVELFAQGDLAIPLLIDTSGDGTCDEVNVDALPQAQRPVKVQLAPVNPRGQVWYRANTDLDAAAHDAPADCVAGTANESVPSALCPSVMSEGLYRIPATNLESKPPAIYAINPTNGNTGECAGITWELLPIVGEGWACLVARAEDNIGNVGVSKPLRVCIDDGVGTPPCDPVTDPWPDCTDNCELPVGFEEAFGPNLMVRQ